MMIDRNKVKVLIDRYMNGETTADEERQLRHFFRTAQSLPDEWLPLRALFAYVDSEAEKSCLPAETQENTKPSASTTSGNGGWQELWQHRYYWLLDCFGPMKKKIATLP